MPSVIELCELIKDYKNLRALDHVDLTIGEGITGLLGPNGAGKSTLIKVILGLVKLNSGHGKVLGLDIATQAREVRAAIGYMPEDDCYIAGMNGVEMVRFTASLNGMPPLEGLRRSHEILDFCGMGQERYRDVETYSTGMRQKLKFAQAIVHDPQLLILDEPTSGLDPEERVAMLNRIRSLAKEAQKVTLLSTHILPDVRQVCDHVVILAGGRICLDDTMENVNQPSNPGVFLRVLQKVDSLLSELGERFNVERIDEHQLFLAGEMNGDESLIWEAAQRAGSTITAMHPSQNSLEQVFMRAVEES